MKFNTLSSFDSNKNNHRVQMPSFWNIKVCDFDLTSKQAAEARANKILQISMLEELTFKDDRNKNSQSNLKATKKKQKELPFKKVENTKLSNLKNCIQEEKELMRILIKDEDDTKQELIDKKKRGKLVESWQSKKFDKKSNKFQDETFFVKVKKRSNSIATYIPRHKIKYHLSSLQKSELTMLFNDINLNRIFSNPSRRRRSIIEPEIKQKLKYKAKSLEIKSMGESLTNFYIQMYLKREKERQEKLNIQHQKEKTEKIKHFKQRTKKDKYFLPGAISYSDLQLNQFKATSTISKFTNCTTTHSSGFNFTHTKFNSQNSNFNTKYTQAPKTMTNFSSEKQTFPSITFGLTATNYSAGKANQTYTSQNLTHSPNQISQVTKINKKNNSEKLQKQHFKLYHKLSNDIVSKCTTTANMSNQLKEELGGVLKSYTENIDSLKRLMGQSDLQEMKEQLTKEGQAFKDVKRFFIQPLGKKKKEFISSDDTNALRQAKQVETLNENMAYRTRGLIFNKFDTKLEKGDVIGYVPDVKKDQTLKDFIVKYHKKKTVRNSKALQHGYLNLQMKNNELSDKVSVMVNKFK